MASSKEYLQFILGQLAELEEISYRAMMGEFIIYYRGKIVGGIIKSFCRDCSLRCMGSCRRRKGRKRSRKVK